MFNAPPQWFPSPAVGQVFQIVASGWFVIEAINFLLARRATSDDGQDRGSLWLILATIWGSIGGAYASRFLGWGTATSVVQELGLGLMLVGIALREWAILMLGRYFSVVVVVQENHRLITRGPYRWLRHPAYSGSILTVIGFSLTLGTWLAAVLAGTMSLLACSYRARLEEQALSGVFGDAYRDYMRHTRRFFPGW